LKKYKDLVVENLASEKMDFEDSFIRIMKNTNRLYDYLNRKPKLPSSHRRRLTTERSQDASTDQVQKEKYFSDVLMASTQKYKKFLDRTNPV